MPTLTDPRAEAFAQHRAYGANLEDAYELAGFAGGQRHASRFARRRKVAARVRELIEAGRRQPVTGQDIAFELKRMVRHFEDFDSPQRMRETRETLMELRKVQMDLERERYHERERVERNSPRQARKSPKPPVSAWSLPPAPRAAALALAASPLAIGVAQERGRPVRVFEPASGGRDVRPPVGSPSATGMRST
jgi:hypothetical protein